MTQNDPSNVGPADTPAVDTLLEEFPWRFTG
jgi:hypothetical protein